MPKLVRVQIIIYTVRNGFQHFKKKKNITERMRTCAKHFQECMYTSQMALSCCCFSFSTLCLPMWKHLQNNLDYCHAETQLNTQCDDRTHGLKAILAVYKIPGYWPFFVAGYIS